VTVEGFKQSMVASGQAPLPAIPMREGPLPVPYKEAVRMLAAVRSLDEALYFDSAADALAAWAKVYQNDEVTQEARALKLHAYRRMGELAQQIDPPQKARHSGGPRRALIRYGLKPANATAAANIAKMPAAQFEKAVSAAKPPSPIRLARDTSMRRVSDSYRAFVLNGTSPMGFSSFCRNNPAADLATGLKGDEVAKALAYVAGIRAWCDDFLAALPREPA
jgi:hypothetical protein